MFGNDPRLNPLESRKRLLVAESEINRVQLTQEWHDTTDGIRSLAHRVKSVSSLASVAALLVAGLSAFRRGKPVSIGTQSYWLQSVLKAAQLAGSIWLAIRARQR